MSFVKHGRMVMPLPSRVYLPDQPLALYFEIYHLLLGPDERTRYRVDYEAAGAGGEQSFELSSSGEESGTSRTAPAFATLDISRIPSGDYFLTVRVIDIVGHHERIAVARFSKSE